MWRRHSVLCLFGMGQVGVAVHSFRQPTRPPRDPSNNAALRWNAVSQDAAPADFVEPDHRLRVLGEMLPEARVDLAVQRGFELCVFGMHAGVERPQPRITVVQVFTVGASRLIFELRDDGASYAAGRDEREQIKQWRCVGVIPRLANALERSGRLRLVFSPCLEGHRQRNERIAAKHAWRGEHGPKRARLRRSSSRALLPTIHRSVANACRLPQIAFARVEKAGPGAGHFARRLVSGRPRRAPSRLAR